ncbi:hypothetical protein [Leptolyngbya sp. GGD]|uniref:hypothetical protein n=1 Tax=Leptolyngbya sp. GGD TaxID=2997907 RepID=UPI001AC20985|nr:hypothetical protein [Leptolyngbya sp. GGD]MBN8562914.1 hypothetical protein [Leptolyngbya sp. UWPOB_LEPTO1]MCY6493639.1 hypothetical protein [Leptolyngbya sp. GGD]
MRFSVVVLSVRQTWKSCSGIIAHVTIAAVAIAGVITIQYDRLKQPSITLETPEQAEQQERVRLTLLSKMPSFGFDNMVANWTFLNFVQYYGDAPARKVTGFSLAPQYFDIVTRHDPRFVDSYLFISGSISHQLGQPELALKLMKRGTDALTPQMHPKAFSVWRFAGLDQILLLGDLPGAAKSFEMTAKWAAESEEYKQFAPNFQETANFLKTKPNIEAVQFQAWQVVYQDALEVGDQQSVDRARRELLKLGAIERKNEQGETVFIMPTALQEKAPPRQR